MRIHSETNSVASTNETNSVALLTRKRSLYCVAISFTLLVAVTHGLWLPGFTPEPSAAFPRVPLIRIAASFSPVLDYVALSVSLVAAWMGAITTRENALRSCGLAFCMAAVCLILSDQHRLQPWLYQFAILYGFAAVLQADPFVRFSRWLLVSIYVFSAISKFDHAFVHTMGVQMVDTLLSPVWSPNPLDANARSMLAGCLPVLELGVGVGLMLPVSRLLAARLGIGLHCVLICILSPVGMNHALGVLLWNATFIALLVILYVAPRRESIDRSLTWRGPSRLAWLVVLLPILEPTSLIDHWPAWQLYAPRNSRIQMRIVGLEDERLKNMPPAIRRFVHTDNVGLYAFVDLDEWSLQSTRVPNYPQDRFQLGVAIAFCERFDLGTSTQVTMESVSARWTGKRRRRVLRGIDELKAAANQFRLNALPPESL